MSPLGMNVRTWVGTMNKAGIDCDAGERPGYIPRWNAGMPSQFPAPIGCIQGAAQNATFKRPESDGLANGVGDDGVAVVLRKGAANLVKRAYLHSSVIWMSAYWHCINFLRDRRKTGDKPEKFDQDEGSTLHVERP
jgi:hypothetical protein